MKSMLLLVPALQLQTPTCLLGLRANLLSSSSSPPLPLLPCFLFPLFKSSQASTRLCLLTLSSRDRWEQTAWQFLLFICFLAFSPWLLSPSFCLLQIELREILDLAF